MILKELDPFVATDKFGAAGRKAEEQLAYYLKHGFRRDDDIVVINGIRFEHDGFVAQIDHLVLHPFGFIIIESKSVSDCVRIDANGHWTRQFGGKEGGMPSPINQARRQADSLQLLLSDRLDEALGPHRGLLAQAIGAGDIDVVVAISDHGRIDCAGPLDAAVIKADEVIDRVGALVEARRPQVALGRAVLDLSARELHSVGHFLLANHRPAGGKAAAPAKAAPRKPKLEQKALPQADPPTAANAEPDHLGRREPTLGAGAMSKALSKVQRFLEAAQFEPQKPEPEPEPEPAPTAAASEHSCSKCGGTAVEIRHGKFGYYFKCRGCDGNTAIKATCPACGKPARVRKKGLEFFTDCKPCDTSAPFFTNPAEPEAAAQA